MENLWMFESQAQATSGLIFRKLWTFLRYLESILQIFFYREGGRGSSKSVMEQLS